MPNQRQESLVLKLPISRAKQLQLVNRPEAAGVPKQPASTPSKLTEYFSQSQLAIALAISKSKPAGLSSEEYLEQLRKHIKSGQPIPRHNLRHIDTAEFWKDQYTRIHLEKKTLEDKVRCLEEARRLSKKRHHAAVEPNASQDSQGDIGLSDNIRLPEEPEMSLANDDYLRLSSYALRIRRHCSTLKESNMDSNNLDNINTLATQTLQVLNLLEKALPDCCLPLKLFKDTKEYAKTSFAFQQVMNQFALAFLVCLTAVDDLCRTIPGRTKKAEIVYRMVMIINQGLELLRSISADQAAHESTTQGHGIQYKRQKTVSEEFLVNKYLAKALAAIAQNASWNPQQLAHSEILEGMLFSTLEHTGRLVSEAVFGEHIATSDLPGNITKSNGAVHPGFVGPEARYIIQVLHATTGAGNRGGLVTQMLAAGKTPLNAHLRMANPNSPNFFGDLLSKTKNLLQSTLVKSAVGDPELESLRLPTPPVDASDIVRNDGVEIYGKDWLIEMVWGLIGWDIICSK